MSEYSLLVLPGLRGLLAYPYPNLKKALPKQLRLAFGCYLLFVPLMMIRELPSGGKYPFSKEDIPYGVVRFLQKVGKGGNVINGPNYGGYFRWELYPKYRILMSMESMFTGSDVHMVHNVFRDQAALKKLLSTYDIDFISISLVRKDAPELMNDFPEFVMVCFDDAEALYVNRVRNPVIAKEYGMTGVDPFDLIRKGYQEILAIPDKSLWILQFPKLVKIIPDCIMLNYLLAIAYQQNRQYEDVVPLAEHLIDDMPRQAIGYLLKADAMYGMGMATASLSYYHMALSRSNPAIEKIILKRLGWAYFGAGSYKKAYSVLRSGIDVLSNETKPEDIYTMAVLAQNVGERKHARALASYLFEFRVSSDDPVWAERKAELKKAGIDI